MDNNLYLIGTHHLDLDGPKRLRKALDKINPNVIGLEVGSIEELEKIVNKPKIILSNQDLNLLAKLGFNDSIRIKLNELNEYTQKCAQYELFLPYHYSKDKNIPLELIDTYLKNKADVLSESFAGLMIKLLESEELKPVILQMLSTDTNKILDLARVESQEVYDDMGNNFKHIQKELFSITNEQIIAEGISQEQLSLMKNTYSPQREDVMAENIRKSYNDGNKKFVSIIGVGHIPGLKKRLYDLHPKIYMLNQFD